MWSDTLLAIERAHLLRVGGWGAASVVVGTVLLVIVAMQRARPALLFHFALQTTAWGALDVAIAAWGMQGLAPRDYAGATRLDRVLWLAVGLDVGGIAAGVVLAVAAWVLGRRMGGVGAGLGVILQGVALLLLDALALSLTGSTL
jgi:hypothetical protein